MTQNNEFVEEWSAEDHETYAGWMRRAEKLRESKDIFDNMILGHVEHCVELVWEKQILPTNIEEYLAVRN